MAFNYCLQIRESLHFEFQNYFFLLQCIGKWPDGDALWFPSLLEACKPATSLTTFHHFDPVSSELNAWTPGVSEALRKEKGLTWHFWMWGSKEPRQVVRLEGSSRMHLCSVYRVKQNKNTNPLNQEHDIRVNTGWSLRPPAQNQRQPLCFSYHLLLDKLQIRQPHLLFNLAQVVPFPA